MKYARHYRETLSLLILDEPSAALTETEIEIMFGLIKNMQERGITVIYISHRIEEIFKIADRVTVLRDGKTIITDDVKKHGQGEPYKAYDWKADSRYLSSKK